MKKTKLVLLSFSSILLVTIVLLNLREIQQKSDIDLRELHQKHLEHSPFTNTGDLTKQERHEAGLPPNRYYERLWELTLDPSTGRPMPERLIDIQNTLRSQRKSTAKGVGGDNDNAWVERGPNNVGGRTRGIMFDPNDVGNPDPNDDYTRVFAGGVSGGLWVNEDITDSNSSWTLVPGIDETISVNVIISDPNDSDVFYIGSGESYVFGDAVGRGIWKSIDGGATWNNIFGGYIDNDGGQDIEGVFYINDLVARDVGATTELYAAVAGNFYKFSDNPNQFHGLQDQGLYKSINGGASWTRFNITESNGTFSNPCDIELDLNNNIWFTTTRSYYGFDGGKIYKSTNGTTFTLEHTISNARRTELEPSSLDANKFWIAADVPGPTANDGRDVDLFITTNAFGIVANMLEPNDADNDISSTDYAREQAFYNLLIEADANDNLIVGGINLFRTSNDGVNWSQISKWSNNPGLNTLNVSLIGPDQHAAIQRPGAGNTNKFVFGNDNGVYYTDNINAFASSNAITSRNENYITSQFYYGDISNTDLTGGTQDNGTLLATSASNGTNSFVDPFGGDGGYTEIDDSRTYMIQSYPRNTHRYISYPSLATSYTISTPEDAVNDVDRGDFINQAELDENLNILYTNASTSNPDNFVIERISNFTSGSGNVVNDFLTNNFMDARPTALKVSPHTTSSTTLLIGLENGKVLQVKTADTSPNWLNLPNINPIGEFTGSVSDLAYGIDETEIFVTIHNYGVTSIWFSDDSGASWVSIEGNLPDLPVKCILQNPLLPSELIIGTELGVWSTSDYTVTNPVWQTAYNGMSDVTVLDLDLRPSDNTILATTHGRGLFTSQFTSVPLSVNENQDVSASVKVYPTISNGDITISTSLNLGKSKLQVFNISGKEVFNTDIDLNANTQKINLTSFSSGLYLIKINKNNLNITKKIILK
ncbi:T9SS type A sorting domain-containing protein [Hyunsoonleella aestuarii]|uniref:Exo-alpha-sialidase n=1 Tax=Hyunsoonleella aestuarii TaxID=912802 RepID=A0ABP8E763_9FLAO|nr:T9SS type A sorting domain-containing protein [Hyunsoonleella aestuarii]